MTARRRRSSSRVVRPIVKATDLGGVQVLKHGNLYLLTDPFGDVHPDTRGLGLYDGDTRRLSCCDRCGSTATRPVLLQASGGRQLPRRDPADEPDASSATWSDKVQPGGRARRAEARDRARPADRRRRCSRSGSGSSTTPRRRDEVEVELELARRRRRHLRGPRLDPRPARGAPAADRAPPRPRRRSATTASTAARSATHLAFTRAARPTSARSTPDVAGSANAGWVRLTLATGTSAERRRRASSRWAAPGPPSGATAASPGDRRRASPTALFPEPPRVDARRRVAALVPRLEPQHRPTIRTDNELFNLAIERVAGDLRLLINDGPRPGRALPRGRRPVVRDAVRARLHHHGVPDARRSGRRSPSRRSRSSPRSRRPRTTRARRGARQDPPRAADRRDGPRRASCRTAVLRHRRRDAAVADPARRDVRLDRRPGAGRPAVAERARARSTGSTATATATATGSSSTSAARRAGSSTRAGRTRRDCDPRPARPRWPRPPIALAEVQGYVYDAKRRMAGLARGPRRGGARRPPGRGGGDAPRPLRGRVLVRGPARSTRWPSTARSARSTRSPRTPATACGPGSSSPERARRRRASG